MISKVPILTKEDLGIYYTPGVAFVSNSIKENKEKVYDYTNKANTIAIISDGTRILGLGNIGPEAGLPVMEGKAILFKKFGGVDAIPICIKSTEEEEIIKVITAISPSFGGINIEDIESPKSFRIVNKLSETLDIPVFHDDQQGTGVVALAAVINSLKLVNKDKKAKIVVSGAGSAGFGISTMLNFAGFKNIYVIDSKGIIYEGREEGMNEFKNSIAKMTNPDSKKGTLDDAVSGADLLIGVSMNGKFEKNTISKMAEKPIVLALSNPTPEISYTDAKAAGAYIVGTGSSNTPNQVNNAIVFPGIMRGLLEVRSRGVNNEILYSAAIALAKSVGKRLSTEFILPSIVDKKDSITVTSNIASAVAESSMKSGLARINKSKEEVKKDTKMLLKRYSKIENKILKIK